MNIKIETLAELDKAIADNNGKVNVFIQLMGGLISRKRIKKNPNGKYKIFNGIDDTTDIVDKIKIFDQRFTNVGMAMNEGALNLEQD